jgi:hypothetical protein
MADFGKLNFSVAFNPTSAFPLDARSYFESLAEAQAAAASAGEVGSTSTVYYYGQKLLVKEGSSYKWYEIGADKTLKEADQASGEAEIYMRSSGGYIQFSTNNADWENVIAISALKGEKGDKGDKGEKGADGAAGATGEAGADGADGLSAYEIAQNHGFEGTEAEWLESLKGKDGEDGKDGADGVGGGGSGECNLPDIAPKPETELISSPDTNFTYDSFYGWHMYSVATVLNLVAGDKCRIVWDTDEYYCTVVDVSSVLTGYKAIGNLAEFGFSGNDEPFIIAINDAGTAFAAIKDTAPDTHSFAVYKVGASPDEEKFLQVVDGKATWVTIALAEDGGF